MRRDRSAYWAEYYAKNRTKIRRRYRERTEAQKARYRATQQAYRKENAVPIKIARSLGIPIQEARELLS